MPMIKVSDHTLQLIREQTQEGYSFVSTATRSADGQWTIPVDDDIAVRVATQRLLNETDDEVLSRLVRTAIGIRSDSGSSGSHQFSLHYCDDSHRDMSAFVQPRWVEVAKNRVHRQSASRCKRCHVFRPPQRPGNWMYDRHYTSLSAIARNSVHPMYDRGFALSCLDEHRAPGSTFGSLDEHPEPGGVSEGATFPLSPR
jgi:hypothetical protein